MSIEESFLELQLLYQQTKFNIQRTAIIPTSKFFWDFLSNKFRSKNVRKNFSSLSSYNGSQKKETLKITKTVKDFEKGSLNLVQE